MAFSSQAFRRNRATEMVLELQASLVDEQRLDRGADRQVGRVERFLDAVERWIAARVPATSQVFVLLGGANDGLHGWRAVDALRDRENARQLALAKQLAGLLDGVEERVSA